MMRSSRRLRAGLLLIVLAVVPVGVVAVRDMGTGAGVLIVPVGASPDHVAVDTRAGRAFVTNYGDDSLSVIAARGGAVLHTVPVGSSPTRVVVNGRTGRAFVLNYNDNSVSVLNAATGFVLRTVKLSMVGAVAVDEGTGHIFVAGGCGGMPGTVAMLDARSGTVLHTLNLGSIPQQVTVDGRTRRAFVTDPVAGIVSLLDTATGRVVRTVAMGGSPTGVAVDERTGHAFVTNSGDNTVSVLDARSGTVLRTVAVGAAPSTLAVAVHTGRVFVVNARSGTVSVLDARTGAVRRTVRVGAIRPQAVGSTNPLDVAVDERAGRVFVLNGSGFDRNGNPTNGSVSVLDAGSGRVLHRIAVSPLPLAVAVDQTTAHLFVAHTQPGDQVRTTGGGLSGQTMWTWVPQRLRRWIPLLPHLTPPTRTGSVTVIDTTRL
jgi:YVTN family beta-propeller protein